MLLHLSHLNTTLKIREKYFLKCKYPFIGIRDPFKIREKLPSWLKETCIHRWRHVSGVKITCFVYSGINFDLFPQWFCNNITPACKFAISILINPAVYTGCILAHILFALYALNDPKNIFTSTPPVQTHTNQTAAPALLTRCMHELQKLSRSKYNNPDGF